MEDRSLAAEWTNQTDLHPLGLAAAIVLGLIALLLPRRYAILPLILMCCFVAPGQRLVIATLDFTLLRIMVLVVWLRMLVRGEIKRFTWKTIDTLVLAAGVTELIAFTMLYMSGPAFVRQLGNMFDLVGMYFAFRLLIRDWRDFDRAMLVVLLVSIPVAISFLFEAATRQNVFSIFGGVPEITPERQGRLRCQGAFPHPILAGCFWAGFLPIFASRWWRGGRQRVLAVVGVITSGIMVYTSASSTPLLGAIGAVLAALMFLVRDYLRLIRWTIVALLTMAHFMMNNGVWHLLIHVNVVGGSTGWHRYYLIDQAINHFREWALFGTKATAHWGLGLQDVTNHYILQGVRGGIATMVLFIAVIVAAFRAVGRMTRAAGKNKALLAASWALGVSLFVHCLQFIGVAYFGGQLMLAWYILIAAIATLSPVPQPAAARDRRRRRAPQDALRRPQISPLPPGTSMGRSEHAR
ncbi:MAG: hypothetical protein D6744_07055 [Planctomycetota bacterium]|nr:MAG: hypothetical protein D6744_07055 [Planctomycetota bacterium]